MSQQHIPQPDTAPEAPGEQIQSTDTALPMTSIEVTQPSFSQEIVPAVGEFNGLDPWFYTQFRQIDTLTWTTSDEPGKLLWYVPLNPLALDKNLAYISKLYLAWAGDFVFNFKVAGTGFHAGLLTFVKTPPTIHPSRITNPEDFSIMPWDAVDPKMLEVGSMMGRDIRPIKYHYVQQQENAPADYAIGGYLALFVNLPLSTSASGVPRINIAIWVKNSMNFKFGWMLPYNLQTEVSSLVPPDGLNTLLDFTQSVNLVPLASYPVIGKTIDVLPAATKVLNVGLYNTFKLDGTTLSKYGSDYFGVVRPPNALYIEGHVDDVQGKVVTARFREGWLMIPLTSVVFYKDKDTYQSGKITKMDTSIVKDTRSFTFETEQDPVFKLNDVFYVLWDGEKATASEITDNEIAPPVTNESFLGFASDELFSVQTYPIAYYFANHNLSTWLPEGRAALFQIYEAEQNLPIGMAKLYREGYFTTRASTNKIQYIMNKIKFKFVSFTLPTASIPQTAEMTRDKLMVSMIHEKALKKMRRQNTSAFRHELLKRQVTSYVPQSIPRVLRADPSDYLHSS